VVLLKNFLNIFYIPELRKKFLFTLGVLIIYRLGNHIPVIGVDVQALQALMGQSRSTLGAFFGYMDMFSGGAFRQATLFALSIMPYITASIMMQMLGMTVPYLEQLLKEGEYGRKIVNQYTRYLAFFVALFQSVSYMLILEGKNLVLEPGSWSFRITFILSLTVAAMFVMWLGEQISLFGLGNGSSMIIFAGIVARMPDNVGSLIYQVRNDLMDPLIALLIVVGFVVLAGFIVFMERGERKIPVQYTRRVVGQRVYGGQSTYIPFKINTAGVMPVILAGAVLQIPMFIASLLAERFAFFKTIAEAITMQSAPLFIVLQFLLIIFFSFFYTALVYNPDELADNMKKSGGFIPGIRPGKSTAQFFNYILTRIGLVGALYLGILAILPAIVGGLIGVPAYILGSGTALLIVVGVGLDIAAQIESYLIENRYEGFLSTGRLKGRIGR
jgi:preprotein translocase subunit SecY